MDDIRRRLLQVHRQSIVQDLDVKFIIDNLISLQALKPDDFEYLLELPKRRDQAAALLDFLPRNGSYAYDTFVDCLKKDYHWLWEKLQVAESSTPKDIVQESFEDGLSRGDVPRLPVNYVHRQKLENEIKKQMVDLKRHQMLVLHGMPGSGKSSLAISVLRSDPSLTVNTFQGNIFWINVGDCISEEQIVALQSRVYRKIFTSESYRDDCLIDAISDMSRSTSLQSTGTEEPDMNDYRQMLKGAFEDLNFKESLLVVDDVRLTKVVEAFDVGCKVLITTQDISIVRDFHPAVVSVSDSLTEQESLELISMCAGMSIEQLPRKAAKLHRQCQGAPLLMALLGAMLAENIERLQHDTSYWNQIYRQLKNKNSFTIFNIFKPEQSKPYTAIEMCINSLGDKNKIKTYESLAVLPNNVKISVKALSILLDMSELNVETLMKQLKNKSLVIEHFSIDLKIYQYEVHDLIMLYLKYIRTEEEMKRLHAGVILRYKERCLDKSLVHLPDDGYIVYYIGYHIQNTENLDNMWDLFHSLYTNILFVGTKIRLAGPTDLILDLNKYSPWIVKKASDNDYLAELFKFIQSHAYDLYHYPNTEIIQSILQHCQKGILFNKAHHLATHSDNRNHLFFQFQSEDNAEDTNYVPLDVRDAICVIRIWLEFVLVGNANGNITLWSLWVNKKLKIFQGHSGAIKAIAVNEKTPFKIATTSEDGTMKIWNIDDENEENGYDDVDSGDTGHIPCHCESIESATTVSHTQGGLSGCSWGHGSDILLAHLHPGSALLLYSADGLKLKEIRLEADFTITCSILSLDDNLMICGYERKGPQKKTFGIQLYSVTSGDLMMSFVEKAPVLLITLVPDSSKSIMILTKSHLHKQKWNHSAPVSLSQARSHTIQTSVADIEALQQDFTFETGCISADGTYMFVSTTDCRILVYNIKTNSLVSELNNHRGIVTSIDTMSYWDHENDAHSHHLITKSGDDVHTVKLWVLLSSQLIPDSETCRKGKLSLKFDCLFDKALLNSPVISDFHYHSGPSVRRAETLERNAENSPKVIVQKSISLDRHSLRPLSLNLKNGSLTNLNITRNPLIAVIDKSNKIQILRGKKLIVETANSKYSITTVAFSPCGQYLAYGLKNGVVNIFVLNSRFTKKIMDLNGEVNYLEFLSVSILIAAGKNCGLMVYEIVNSEQGDSVAKMIISSNELGSQELIDKIYWKRSTPEHEIKKSSPVSLSSLPITEGNSSSYRTCPEGVLLRNPAIVKCFWLEGAGLMSVACDGSVKMWSLEPKLLSVVMCRQHNFGVSLVTLYKSNILVLCDTRVFQVYHLVQKGGDDTSAVFHDTNKTDGNITCCAISYDGRILAMGQDSGEIVLWHISSKSMLTTLSLHRSKVRCLKFSPGPRQYGEVTANSPFAPKSFVFPSPAATASACFSPESREESRQDTPLVLVSLAGQIAFWNISYVLANKVQQKRRSKGGIALHLLSPRSSNLELNCFAETESTSHLDHHDVQWENLWKGKSHKNNCTQKELLSCIKLVGDEADNLMVDEKFSKFVTIDQSGTLYIMDVLDNTTMNGNS